MNNKIKGRVSYYNNASDTTSKSWVVFDDVLNFIKQSPDHLINLTNKLNNLYAIDENEYKRQKRQLPMICGSGCFSYRNGDLTNLKEYSNILILDFDWDKPDAVEIVIFRQKLIQYATPLHIYAIWKSPAKGLKVAMIHNNRESAFHTELFISVKKNLYSRTPQFDMKCKDISRTCYLCHDPNLFINTDPNLTEYHFVHNPDYHTPTPTTHGSHSYNGKFQHTSQEIMMNKLWQQICPDKKLMNMIVKSCNATNPDYYKDGNRHKEVIRRATLYCIDGVLYDNAIWSLIGLFGESSRAGLMNSDIESMVNSCYNKARNEFGTKRQEYLDWHYNKNIPPIKQV